MNKEIKIFPTIEELNRFAADEFVRLSREAIAASGRFTVALSGGSTPRKLYALLASDEYKNRIEWQKVHFFFGDERNVSPNDEESNFRMANEAMFSKLDVSAENIHRFQTELTDAKAIAARMENEVKTFFDLKENEFPRLDLFFLGMGDDGHTASLFPETAALTEDKKIVVENYVTKFDAFRLTFTFPAINNAKNIIFLIAGADKAEVLKEVLEGEEKKYPAQNINPPDGELLFLLDEKSAKLVSA